MKKISLFIFLLAVGELSCLSDSYLKMKIEIPGLSPFNLEQFKEIVMTNFLLEKEMKDFDLNEELLDYMSPELARKFKGKISKRTISWEKQDLFKSEDFWKALAPDLKQALFLTGKAQYTQETRKALLEKEKVRFEDTLRTEKSLAERKVFTLELDLYFIDAETGKVLLERNYKETRSYPNPKQTAHFAFFELMANIKTKLFQTILREGKTQERYILLK